MTNSRKSAANARVGVCSTGDSEGARVTAIALADELSLPLVATYGGGDCDRFDLLLVVDSNRLELREVRRRVGGPIFVDFVGGATGFRRRSAGTRRQPIARAIGLRGSGLSVVDATAGLGRDTFLLACLGCEVSAVERSPVLGALLRDGLSRAAEAGDDELQTIVRRVSLTVGDARQVLADVEQGAEPDVVYLDPMYPPKSKSALAKKEMRICRRLVGFDADAEELLTIARGVARRRVVVKRYRHAPPLLPGAALKYVGRTVRYDVYHPS